MLSERNTTEYLLQFVDEPTSRPDDRIDALVVLAKKQQAAIRALEDELDALRRRLARQGIRA